MQALQNGNFYNLTGSRRFIKNKGLAPEQAGGAATMNLFRS